MPEREEDMSSYSEGQTHLLMEALEAAGYTAADVTLLGQAGKDRLKEIRLVLKAEAKIVLIPKPRRVSNLVNSTIRINRPLRSAYPDWVDKVLHPELEMVGPAKYDISRVEQWLHEGQKGGKFILGQVIYEYLKEKKMLESCLGLADLLAIQTKGIDFFRKHFAGKAVFGWKSVVQHRDGNLRSPYLYDGGEQVVLRWGWLGLAWNSDNPALRLAN